MSTKKKTTKIKNYEEITEWLKVTYCKFVGIYLRRFESCSLQSDIDNDRRLYNFLYEI